MGKVINGRFNVTGSIPVQNVLDGAKHLEEVHLIGRTADGEIYHASSTGDVGNILVWIERAKSRLMNVLGW